MVTFLDDLLSRCVPVLCQFLFCQSGLESHSETESGPCQRVFCSYPMEAAPAIMVTELLDEWAAMCHLHAITTPFKHAITGNTCTPSPRPSNTPSQVTPARHHHAL